MLRAAVAVISVLPVLALGHGTAIHARGTIKEITPEHVVVADKGADQTFVLGSDTQIVRGHDRVSVSAIRVGERAVVHARRDGQTLHATELRLVPAGGASKSKEGNR